jgi:hypothetical protein
MCRALRGLSVCGPVSSAIQKVYPLTRWSVKLSPHPLNFVDGIGHPTPPGGQKHPSPRVYRHPFGARQDAGMGEGAPDKSFVRNDLGGKGDISGQMESNGGESGGVPDSLSTRHSPWRTQ